MYGLKEHLSSDRHLEMSSGTDFVVTSQVNELAKLVKKIEIYHKISLSTLFTPPPPASQSYNPPNPIEDVQLASNIFYTKLDSSECNVEDHNIPLNSIHQTKSKHKRKLPSIDLVHPGSPVPLSSPISSKKHNNTKSRYISVYKQLSRYKKSIGINTLLFPRGLSFAYSPFSRRVEEYNNILLKRNGKYMRRRIYKIRTREHFESHKMYRQQLRRSIRNMLNLYYLRTIKPLNSQYYSNESHNIIKYAYMVLTKDRAVVFFHFNPTFNPNEINHRILNPSLQPSSPDTSNNSIIDPFFNQVISATSDFDISILNNMLSSPSPSVSLASPPLVADFPIPFFFTFPLPVRRRWLLSSPSPTQLNLPIFHNGRIIDQKSISGQQLIHPFLPNIIDKCDGHNNSSPPQNDILLSDITLEIPPSGHHNNINPSSTHSADSFTPVHGNNTLNDDHLTEQRLLSQPLAVLQSSSALETSTTALATSVPLESESVSSKPSILSLPLHSWFTTPLATPMYCTSSPRSPLTQNDHLLDPSIWHALSIPPPTINSQVVTGNSSTTGQCSSPSQDKPSGAIFNNQGNSSSLSSLATHKSVLDTNIFTSKEVIPIYDMRWMSYIGLAPSPLWDLTNSIPAIPTLQPPPQPPQTLLPNNAPYFPPSADTGPIRLCDLSDAESVTQGGRPYQNSLHSQFVSDSPISTHDNKVPYPPTKKRLSVLSNYGHGTPHQHGQASPSTTSVAPSIAPSGTSQANEANIAVLRLSEATPILKASGFGVYVPRHLPINTNYRQSDAYGNNTMNDMNNRDVYNHDGAVDSIVAPLDISVGPLKTTTNRPQTPLNGRLNVSHTSHSHTNPLDVSRYSLSNSLAQTSSHSSVFQQLDDDHSCACNSNSSDNNSSQPKRSIVSSGLIANYQLSPKCYAMSSTSDDEHRQSSHSYLPDQELSISPSSSQFRIFKTTTLPATNRMQLVLPFPSPSVTSSRSGRSSSLSNRSSTTRLSLMGSIDESEEQRAPDRISDAPDAPSHYKYYDQSDTQSLFDDRDYVLSRKHPRVPYKAPPPCPNPASIFGPNDVESVLAPGDIFQPESAPVLIPHPPQTILGGLLTVEIPSPTLSHNGSSGNGSCTQNQTDYHIPCIVPPPIVNSYSYKPSIDIRSYFKPLSLLELASSDEVFVDLATPLYHEQRVLNTNSTTTVSTHNPNSNHNGGDYSSTISDLSPMHNGSASRSSSMCVPPLSGGPNSLFDNEEKRRSTFSYAVGRNDDHQLQFSMSSPSQNAMGDSPLCSLMAIAEQPPQLPGPLRTPLHQSTRPPAFSQDLPPLHTSRKQPLYKPAATRNTISSGIASTSIPAGIDAPLILPCSPRTCSTPTYPMSPPSQCLLPLGSLHPQEPALSGSSSTSLSKMSGSTAQKKFRSTKISDLYDKDNVKLPYSIPLRYYSDDSISAHDIYTFDLMFISRIPFISQLSYTSNILTLHPSLSSSTVTTYGIGNNNNNNNTNSNNSTTYTSHLHTQLHFPRPPQPVGTLTPPRPVRNIDLPPPRSSDSDSSTTLTLPPVLPSSTPPRQLPITAPSGNSSAPSGNSTAPFRARHASTAEIHTTKPMKQATLSANSRTTTSFSATAVSLQTTSHAQTISSQTTTTSSSSSLALRQTQTASRMTRSSSNPVSMSFSSTEHLSALNQPSKFYGASIILSNNDNMDDSNANPNDTTVGNNSTFDQTLVRPISVPHLSTYRSQQSSIETTTRTTSINANNSSIRLNHLNTDTPLQIPPNLMTDIVNSNDHFFQSYTFSRSLYTILQAKLLPSSLVTPDLDILMTLYLFSSARPSSMNFNLSSSSYSSSAPQFNPKSTPYGRYVYKIIYSTLARLLTSALSATSSHHRKTNLHSPPVSVASSPSSPHQSSPHASSRSALRLKYKSPYIHLIKLLNLYSQRSIRPQKPDQPITRILSSASLSSLSTTTSIISLPDSSYSPLSPPSASLSLDIKSIIKLASIALYPHIQYKISQSIRTAMVLLPWPSIYSQQSIVSSSSSQSSSKPVLRLLTPHHSEVVTSLTRGSQLSIPLLYYHVLRTRTYLHALNRSGMHREQLRALVYPYGFDSSDYDNVLDSSCYFEPLPDASSPHDDIDNTDDNTADNTDDDCSHDDIDTTDHDNMIDNDDHNITNDNDNHNITNDFDIAEMAVDSKLLLPDLYPSNQYDYPRHFHHQRSSSGSSINNMIDIDDDDTTASVVMWANPMNILDSSFTLPDFTPATTPSAGILQSSTSSHQLLPRSQSHDSSYSDRDSLHCGSSSPSHSATTSPTSKLPSITRIYSNTMELHHHDDESHSYASDPPPPPPLTPSDSLHVPYHHDTDILKSLLTLDELSAISHHGSGLCGQIQSRVLLHPVLRPSHDHTYTTLPSRALINTYSPYIYIQQLLGRSSSNTVPTIYRYDLDGNHIPESRTFIFPVNSLNVYEISLIAREDHKPLVVPCPQFVATVHPLPLDLTPPPLTSAPGGFQPPTSAQLSESSRANTPVVRFDTNDVVVTFSSRTPSTQSENEDSFDFENTQPPRRSMTSSTLPAQAFATPVANPKLPNTILSSSLLSFPYGIKQPHRRCEYLSQFPDPIFPMPEQTLPLFSPPTYIPSTSHIRREVWIFNTIQYAVRKRLVSDPHFITLIALFTIPPPLSSSPQTTLSSNPSNPSQSVSGSVLPPPPPSVSAASTNHSPRKHNLDLLRDRQSVYTILHKITFYVSLFQYLTEINSNVIATQYLPQPLWRIYAAAQHSTINTAQLPLTTILHDSPLYIEYTVLSQLYKTNNELNKIVSKCVNWDHLPSYMSGIDTVYTHININIDNIRKNIYFLHYLDHIGTVPKTYDHLLTTLEESLGQRDVTRFHQDCPFDIHAILYDLTHILQKEPRVYEAIIGHIHLSSATSATPTTLSSTPSNVSLTSSSGSATTTALPSAPMSSHNPSPNSSTPPSSQHAMHNTPQNTIPYAGQIVEPYDLRDIADQREQTRRQQKQERNQEQQPRQQQKMTVDEAILYLALNCPSLHALYNYINKFQLVGHVYSALEFFPPSFYSMLLPSLGPLPLPGDLIQPKCLISPLLFLMVTYLCHYNNIILTLNNARAQLKTYAIELFIYNHYRQIRLRQHELMSERIIYVNNNNNNNNNNNKDHCHTNHQRPTSSHQETTSQGPTSRAPLRPTDPEIMRPISLQFRALPQSTLSPPPFPSLPPPDTLEAAQWDLCLLQRPYLDSTLFDIRDIPQYPLIISNQHIDYVVFIQSQLNTNAYFHMCQYMYYYDLYGPSFIHNHINGNNTNDSVLPSSSNTVHSGSSTTVHSGQSFSSGSSTATTPSSMGGGLHHSASFSHIHHSSQHNPSSNPLSPMSMALSPQFSSSSSSSSVTPTFPLSPTSAPRAFSPALTTITSTATATTNGPTPYSHLPPPSLFYDIITHGYQSIYLISTLYVRLAQRINISDHIIAMQLASRQRQKNVINKTLYIKLHWIYNYSKYGMHNTLEQDLINARHIQMSSMTTTTMIASTTSSSTHIEHDNNNRNNTSLSISSSHTAATSQHQAVFSTPQAASSSLSTPVLSSSMTDSIPTPRIPQHGISSHHSGQAQPSTSSSSLYVQARVPHKDLNVSTMKPYDIYQSYLLTPIIDGFLPPNNQSHLLTTSNNTTSDGNKNDVTTSMTQAAFSQQPVFTTSFLSHTMDTIEQLSSHIQFPTQTPTQPQASSTQPGLFDYNNLQHAMSSVSYQQRHSSILPRPIGSAAPSEIVAESIAHSTRPSSTPNTNIRDTDIELRIYPHSLLRDMAQRKLDLYRRRLCARKMRSVHRFSHPRKRIRNTPRKQSIIDPFAPADSFLIEPQNHHNKYTNRPSTTTTEIPSKNLFDVTTSDSSMVTPDTHGNDSDRDGSLAGSIGSWHGNPSMSIGKNQRYSRSPRAPDLPLPSDHLHYAIHNDNSSTSPSPSPISNGRVYNFQQPIHNRQALPPLPSVSDQNTYRHISRSPSPSPLYSQRPHTGITSNRRASAVDFPPLPPHHPSTMKTPPPLPCTDQYSPYPYNRHSNHQKYQSRSPRRVVPHGACSRCQTRCVSCGSSSCIFLKAIPTDSPHITSSFMPTTTCPLDVAPLCTTPPTRVVDSSRSLFSIEPLKSPMLNRKVHKNRMCNHCKCRRSSHMMQRTFMRHVGRVVVRTILPCGLNSLLTQSLHRLEQYASDILFYSHNTHRLPRFRELFLDLSDSTTPSQIGKKPTIQPLVSRPPRTSMIDSLSIRSILGLYDDDNNLHLPSPPPQQPQHHQQQKLSWSAPESVNDAASSSFGHLVPLSTSELSTPSVLSQSLTSSLSEHHAPTTPLQLLSQISLSQLDSLIPPRISLPYNLIGDNDNEFPYLSFSSVYNWDALYLHTYNPIVFYDL